MTSLLIVQSYHHLNTEKLARVMAEVLGAEVLSPGDVDPESIQACEVLGFGSGIYSARHHDAVLEFARRLSPVAGKDCFLFSTAALTSERKMAADHKALREILEDKGYRIVGDFSCRGFNTNSFLKYFGGMNRGRPNAEDLDRARSFATHVLSKADDS